MARRKKIKKKKQDDDLLVDLTEVGGQAGEWYENNQKTILGVAIALVLCVVGYYVYNNHKSGQQAEALVQMAEAEYQFERDSFDLALANPGGGFPGFADIVKQYGGTDAGNAALYYAGVCCLNLGQFDAAISYLDDFDADGEVMPIMKAGTLGDAWCEKGELDKGLGFYKKAVSAGDNSLLTPYYLKKVAMLSEKQGDTGAAKNAWEQLKKEYPKSGEARDADKFLISLK